MLIVTAMLMVVFGAGASYDSFSAWPPGAVRDALGNEVRNDDRPPLANELFGPRHRFAQNFNQYQDVASIATRLRRAGVQVEAELEALRSEGKDDPRRYVQLNAVRFYLRKIIWDCGVSWRDHTRGATNYSAMLDDLRLWQRKHQDESVLLVTFNYDLLLEDACRVALQMPLTSMNAYVEDKRFQLIKLHGSVNWVQSVANDISDTIATEPQLIELGESLKLNRDYRISGIGPDRIDGLPMAPAIAVPVVKKVEYECPDSHVRLMEQALPQVDRAIVVGWRGTEDKFLASWSQVVRKDLRLLIACGPDVAQTRDEMGRRGVHQRDAVLYANGFSNLLTSREYRDFLDWY